MLNMRPYFTLTLLLLLSSFLCLAQNFISDDFLLDYIEMDDVADDLFNEVKNSLVECLKAESVNADYLVDILLIAKYLEKIADHAVNICEWGIFRETGAMENVRIL